MRAREAERGDGRNVKENIQVYRHHPSPSSVLPALHQIIINE